MIKEDDIIKAEEGKILLYKPENKPWGKAARLAQYKGHILTEEDFEEVDESNLECIDNVWYDFRNMSYAAIKTLIIKLHYSNDDQIAIMLNDDEDKMREMQEWCEYASIIACRCTNDISEKVITIPTTTKVFRMYGFPPDCIIHFLASTPPTICSPIHTRVNLYVGDGSSAAHDNAVRQAYLADSTWSTYSSRLDTWYNYLHP